MIYDGGKWYPRLRMGVWWVVRVIGRESQIGMNSGMLLLPNFQVQKPFTAIRSCSLKVSEEYTPFDRKCCVSTAFKCTRSKQGNKFPSSKGLKQKKVPSVRLIRVGARFRTLAFAEEFDEMAGFGSQATRLRYLEGGVYQNYG